MDAISNAHDDGLCPVALWDTLRFWPAKPMRSVPGAVARKRTPIATGKNPRRLNRFLTDPERRIFDHVKKSPGGIVLIDGSGSMDWGIEDIEKMVMLAPLPFTARRTSQQITAPPTRLNTRCSFLQRPARHCHATKFAECETTCVVETVATYQLSNGRSVNAKTISNRLSGSRTDTSMAATQRSFVVRRSRDVMVSCSRRTQWKLQGS